MARTCSKCDRPHKANGLCSTHDNEAKRRAAGAAKREKGAKCSLFEGCERPLYARGGCQAHYQQMQRGVELHEVGPQPAQLRGKHGDGKTPKNTLPEGWDATKAQTAKRQSYDSSAMRMELGPVVPLDPTLEQQMLTILRAHDATDLAEMLGCVTA